MPGPSNGKRKSKQKTKPRQKQHENTQLPQRLAPCPDPTCSNQSSAPSSPSIKTPTIPFNSVDPITKEDVVSGEHAPKTAEEIEHILFQEPFIYDPGNGPRVRHMGPFMSSFFAQPPALDDPLAAEFAQEEVLQMLRTVLPEETALILWYNKSRSTSRVCPSCQRLYRIGDALPDLMEEEPEDGESPAEPCSSPSPRLIREQKISGLCSPVCFVVASFSHPGAIKAAWGCMADEMDEDTWELLSATAGQPENPSTTTELSRSLGMLVWMTRVPDLALAQLCFDAEGVALLEAANEHDVDLGQNKLADLIPAS